MKYFIRTLLLAGLYLLLCMPVLADENAKITLNITQGEIVDVLREIENQSGLNFTYESSVLKGIKKINFKSENEPLSKCLERLFEDLPVTYIIRGRFIILKKKTTKVTISGFVRVKNSNEALVGASVLEQRSRQGTPTNEDGFFSFSVPEGNVQLTISYIGFHPYKKTFQTLNEDTILDIFLEESGQLAEVTIIGNQENQNPVYTPQMGAMKVSQATIKTMPTMFGEADVVKTLQTLPGVSPGVEGFSNMYVRGGNGDENLFLIDGNPLYQVSHLGGLFSSFNAEAIQDMEFYKGAFPARFGGRLSSVVDIKTQEGNLKKYSGSASLGLTSGSFHLNGPLIKDKTGINVAVRRSWFDALTAPALAIVNKSDKKDGHKSIARYAFTDLNFRLDHHFNADNRGYITFYWGDDLFKWGEENFPSKSEENKELTYLDKNIGKLRWGNIMGSAGWIHRFHPKTMADFSVVFTRYNSNLQYESFTSSGNKGSEEYQESFSDTNSENGIMDLGAKASFTYTPSSSHSIRYGVNYYNHHFRPEYVKNRYSGEAEVPQKIHDNETLSANEANIYIEDDWNINKTIHLNAGLRFSIYKIGKKTYNSLEPRLSARFLLSEDMSMKVSYARMNQYVHQISDNYISLPTDMWLPVSEKFKPLSSDQVAAGLYYSLKNEYSFSLEGYYKWMNNLLDYKDGHNVLPSFVGWEDKMAAGKGWSYGIEMMARKDKGKVTGWIGYGLMWADRQFDEINDGVKYPAKYDNRHKVNIVANWKVSEKVELTGSWTYMTGNRMTLSLEEYMGLDKPKDPINNSGYWTSSQNELEYHDGRNNFRLPNYHRLDLGINIYRPKKNGRMGIWNVSIYNVYSRFNPITVRKDFKPKYTDNTTYPTWVPCFKTFSFMPIIPSVSYTLKF